MPRLVMMQGAGRGCERPSLCSLSLRLLSLPVNFHILASVLVWNAMMAPVTLPEPHQCDRRMHNTHTHTQACIFPTKHSLQSSAQHTCPLGHPPLAPVICLQRLRT